jgi:hypothetical protein
MASNLEAIGALGYPEAPDVYRRCGFSDSDAGVLTADLAHWYACGGRHPLPDGGQSEHRVLGGLGNESGSRSGGGGVEVGPRG